MRVLNDIQYNRVNFQCKMLGGFDLHKNDKSWRFESIHCSLYSDLYIYYFCVAQTPKYFALKICTALVYIIENVHAFFQIFLKLLNMFFEFFKIVGLLELGSTKSPLGILSLSLTRNQLARAVFVTTTISRERYRHMQQKKLKNGRNNS